MISVLNLPRPHKTLSIDDATSSSSLPAPVSRSVPLSLPTPAPSPSPSQISCTSTSVSASSSSVSTFSSPASSMLALGSAANAFAPFVRSFSPFASPAFSPSKSSRVRALRHCMPATPDSSCMALPGLESSYAASQLENGFRNSKSRVLRLTNIPSSSDAATHALASLFPLFFFSPSSSTATFGSKSMPTPLKMWTLRPSATAWKDSDVSQRPVWAVFASHEEACAALSASGSGGYESQELSPVNVLPALESELEPFAKLKPFEFDLHAFADNDSTIVALDWSRFAHSTLPLMRYPPSPTSTSTNDTEAETEMYFPDAQDDFDFAYKVRQFGQGQAHAQGLGLGLGLGLGPECVARRNAQSMSNGMMSMSTSMSQQSLQTMQTCGFTLSTNPPKARPVFRHGDWICAVPACAAHNFGRNSSCIQCAAPRPPNLASLVAGAAGDYSQLAIRGNGTPNAYGTPSVTPTTAARNASPRFANSMNNLSQMQAQAQARNAMQQQQQLSKVQAQAPVQAQAHPLLTPSGRAFAVGGKVLNISPDPLAPCIMFWPDNEPLPDPGQIRPATLANVHQPPIMNTGNKGPIEHQPGDWICQKCEYLNWRRRKVCQTCFPYAEGNGDSISATMHAERLALLAAVYGQSHPQVTNAYAQAFSQVSGQAQNINNTFQRPSTTPSSQNPLSTSNHSSMPNYPFTSPLPSAHRSQFPSARQIPIPGLQVTTSVTNPRAAPIGLGVGGPSRSVTARRAVSSPETPIGSGSIVYQTPPSPAATRPPPSISSSLALTPGAASSSPNVASPASAGPFLPSFLKHGVQPLRGVARPSVGSVSGAAANGNGTRTPASLSPASSTSADLPFEEHEVPSKAVGVIGSGRASNFYAHPRGTGSGSSMGSSSSLALGGSSIWSLERDEGKAWNNGVFAAVEAFKGLNL